MKGQKKAESASHVSIWNNPKYRSVFAQVTLLITLILVLFYFYVNTVTNLSKLNTVFGFQFLNQSSGFDIIQTPIDYNSGSSNRRALEVGIINTLLVSVLGVIFATILGFTFGVMRLSKNWLANKIATFYVETVRNVPLLLQILVWYAVVLKPLPSPKQAWQVGSAFLSNRGLTLPKPVFEAGSWVGLAGLVLGVGLALIIRHWAIKRQRQTGEQFHYIWVGFNLIVLLPVVFLLLAGWPIQWSMPSLAGFNFTGGMTVIPEFMALLAALSIYTGAFIAEIVRAGVQSVSHGQTEAAYALGLRPALTTRLITVPQAMRVIIPPLTNQYLNLTKNSSLAIAIAYPELVAIGGTIINQKGKAIEIVIIWMIFYLTISLLTSAFMNWFNSRVKLVER